MASCPNCKIENERYARFCFDCGGSLAAPKISPCLGCGSTEVLSGPFCIACGAEQNAQPIKVQRFTWNSELSGRESKRLLEAVEKQKDSSSVRSSLLVALLAGIVFGGLVFSFLKTLQNLQTLPLFGKIPAEGLTVFSKEANLNIALKKISDSTVENVYYLGEADSGGTFTIAALEPGDYTMTLGSPGKMSAIQTISLSQNNSTVLGYPQKIELPEDSD